jgi:hypothetical protein
MALLFFPNEIIQEIFLHVKFETTRSVCQQWKELSDDLEIKRNRITVTQKMLKIYINSQPLRFNMFNIFFLQDSIYCIECIFKLDKNGWHRGFERRKDFFCDGLRFTSDEIVIHSQSKNDIIVTMDCRKNFYLPGTDIINHFINKHPVYNCEKKDIKDSVLKSSIDDYRQMIIKSSIYDSKIISHNFLADFFLKNVKHSEFSLP